jgi:hypothetical protein
MNTDRAEPVVSTPAAEQGASPGPWSARSDPCHFDSLTDIYDADDRLIARTCGMTPEDFPVMEPNTRLIAAAPDLLRACEDCMEDRGDWVAVMFDAISKARGER